MGKDGIVLIDKPAGITSRKVVDRVMRILNVKRAGHFGTLDPFATGLLCIGVGQGTKLLPFMQGQQKEYVALVGFDMSTDTDDVTGEVLERFSDVAIDEALLKRWFEENSGWIDQTPPEYCAQKLNGKPLYKLKREKKDVSPRSKQVHLEETEILATGTDWARVRIVCSRGTYIRAIARDLGKYLGYGGYLRELERIRSEGFSIDQAVTLEALEGTAEASVIPLIEALKIPRTRVTKTGEAGIRDGQPIQMSWVVDDVIAPDGAHVALLNANRDLLCVARVQRQGGFWGNIERGFGQY
ncbi:MAG TPA: tRNA pseudouridine(55) synthase TruB [Deltaproteobacteria bacterium]|nr:tRNA pseudouridine(55) synthase TruB [Deltaproteobacteria bacterium]